VTARPLGCPRWPSTARAFAARPPPATPARTCSEPPPTTGRSSSRSARSGDKGSEIGELAALVAELDLAGTAVTVDALHTQRSTAEHLVGARNADYVMTIKANQPRLLAAAQQALSGPAAQFTEHTDQARGHGRTEQRILRTAAVTTEMGIEFPHAVQVFRVIRHVGGLDGQRRTKEVAYCVTSLPPARADASDLGQLLRGHWSAIENRTHWVRDTTFNEDASTLRTGTAAQAMSIIRIL